MAAIVTGTVVLWRVVNRGKRNERVQHVTDKAVRVYVADENDQDDEDGDPDALAIISQFILDAVKKVKEKGGNEENQLEVFQELLKSARDGLLRVVGIKRTSVKPPRVPLNDESDESDESVGDESDEGKRPRRT